MEKMRKEKEGGCPLSKLLCVNARKIFAQVGNYNAYLCAKYLVAGGNHSTLISNLLQIRHLNMPFAFVNRIYQSLYHIIISLTLLTMPFCENILALVKEI